MDMSKLIVVLIRVYQSLLSPLFPPRCRFYPSCSEYTRQAVGKYGAARGVWMGVKRLLRCHPFNPGGVDEVSGMEDVQATNG
jgi:putative membrane protein insertion efficiency factor